MPEANRAEDHLVEPSHASPPSGPAPGRPRSDLVILVALLAALIVSWLAIGKAVFAAVASLRRAWG
jgi:hypothetical protein